MATIAVWVKIDGEHVGNSLRDASEKLESADGEVVLDFSSVLRLDASALAALEKLASRADAEGVKLVLHGVSIEIYKVLKLAKLAQRFSFIV